MINFEGGAAEAAIYASCDLDAELYVSNIVNQIPCLVPTLASTLPPFDEHDYSYYNRRLSSASSEDSVAKDDGRELSYYYPSYFCDKTAYY